MRQIAIRPVRVTTLEHNRILQALAGLSGVLLLALLGIYNQPYYPSAWLDEGFALQGPINLVRYGQYAMKSSEGFRVLDQPLIANGPGVTLPISGAFALFGVGLLQARLVAVGYLVLTGIVFFVLARRLFGTPAAITSSFLLLAFPQEGLLWFGRFAVGNVPALAYFLIGYLFWLNLLERDGWGYALGAGFMFGLSLVTKGQYGLIIPAVLIVAFADAVYYKTIGLKKIILVLLTAVGCLAIWYMVQWMVVGPENFGQHLEAVRSSSRVTVFAFSAMRIPRNLWYLIYSGLFLFVVPGLLYAAWSCRKRTRDSYRQLLLVVFVVIWLAWYVFASIGWPRYAFAPYAVGLLFAGKLVVDTILFLRGDNSVPFNAGQYRPYIRAGALLFVVAVLIGGGWGLIQQVSRILAQPDRSPQQFADYLEDHVSQQAVVESFDWQFDVLADLSYHHPPNAWVDDRTAVIRWGEDPKVSYDPFVYQPDYLIDGGWSKWAGIYTPYLADGCCTLVFSNGEYDLYAVNKVATEQ